MQFRMDRYFKNDEKGVSFDVCEEPETYIYDSSYFPQHHNLFFESDSIPLEQIKAVF